MTNIVFLGVAVVVCGLLLFAPFTRTSLWKATVTPLASIIGSGFLVSAPLLASEFGGYAALAMALLIVPAVLIGWALRYNIAVVEGQLSDGRDRTLISMERLSRLVLAFAYFISVTYYLALLGHFVLAAMNIKNNQLADGIAMALLLIIGLIGWTGGATRVARVERYATALNIAVIAGFLAALAAYAIGLVSAGQSIASPPGRLELGSLPVLMGLLIVVQGFETTLFTGDRYDAPTRISAMKFAQILSGFIYVAFFLLLSPLLARLSEGTGVAEIITVSVVVASMLPVSLTVAAAASQLSASIADGIGDAGLIEEISRGRINPNHAFPLIATVGIGILLSVNVYGVIALASRAFALFYSLQCLVAWESARKRRGQRRKAAAFFVLAAISFAVFAFGVPSG